MSKIIKVTAAILEQGGRILIAQRNSTDFLANKWEFPGGKVERGETPAECLARELKEEFDMDVQIGAYLGSSVYHYDHISIELMAFRAYWRGGRIVAKEHSAFAWAEPAELSGYDFAPADLPFVAKIVRSLIRL